MDHATVENAKRDYRNTYVKLKLNGTATTHTIYVKDVLSYHRDDYGEMLETPYFILVCDRGNSYSSLNYTVVIPPRVNGLFNTKKSVVYGRCLPYRQWKVGLCADNYFIGNPISILPKVAREEAVYNVFNPEYYTLEQAIDSILSRERVAAALNKDYFIMPSWYNNKLLLVFNTTVIAELNLDGTLHSVVNRIFTQEAHDILRRAR